MDYDQIERKKVAEDIKTEVQSMDSDKEIQCSNEEMEKAPKKIIKGTRKKRNLLERGVDLLIGSSGVKAIFRDVYHDVVVPSLKDILADAFHSSVDGIIYRGESRGVYSRGYSRNTASSTKSYKKDYTSSYSSRNTSTSVRKYERHLGIEPVIFSTNREAMDVLAELNDEIKQNGFVRVADFYNITGYDDIQHVDNYFGWESVNDCTIRHTRDGWVLYMSEPVSLDY